jgi:hypothetical protein
MNPQKPREFLVIDNTDNSGYSAKIMPEREKEFFKEYKQTTAVNGIYCREVLPDQDKDKRIEELEYERTTPTHILLKNQKTRYENEIQSLTKALQTIRAIAEGKK